MSKVLRCLILMLGLAAAGPVHAADARALMWEDLIPKDWNPRTLYKDLGIAEMDDGDPRADRALAKLRAAWDNAPVVEALNGASVSMPGFIVVLEATEKGATEFLLVPYFGACIHVPPPPANQLVHVFVDKPVPEQLLSYPVTVTGVLETVHARTDYGTAGYRMTAKTVERLKE